MIRVEDLHVRGMTRTARGTIEKPGRNVRAKAGLNRGILAAGWTQLVERLKHKAPGRIEKVNPAYKSQTCNACKHTAPENRESQTVFRCLVCGHQDNADLNAAKNIAGGQPVTARGDKGAMAQSAKREPQLVASQP